MDESGKLIKIQIALIPGAWAMLAVLCRGGGRGLV